MTTVYTEYPHNVNEGIINLANVSFSVKLTRGYVPTENDKITDIEGSLFEVPNVIRGNEINELGIGDIMDKVYKRITAFLAIPNIPVPDEFKDIQITDEFLKQQNITQLVIFDESTNSLCFAESINK